jgi:hypothetical protein
LTILREQAGSAPSPTSRFIRHYLGLTAGRCGAVDSGEVLR